MSLRRRKGSPHWHYDFTLQGHRFRGSCETDDRTLAALLEAKLRHEALKGAIAGTRPTITLDEALGRYVLEVGRYARSTRTIVFLGEGLRAGLGAYRLTELSDDRIADFVARLRGRTSRMGALTTPATVNRHLGLLKAVLRRARDVWRYDVTMPEFKRHWLSEPAPRARYITPEQFARLEAEAAKWLKDPLRFSVLTGIRLTATLTLDWSAVDLQARQMVVPKKSKRERDRHVAPITQALFEILIRQGPREAGPVWHRKGRAIRSWRTAFEGAARRAGLTDFRWHDLRHTAASWAIQGGADLATIKELLGHSTLKETMRYAALEDDAKRKAMEAIESRMRHNALKNDAQAPDKKEKIA